MQGLKRKIHTRDKNFPNLSTFLDPFGSAGRDYPPIPGTLGAWDPTPAPVLPPEEALPAAPVRPEEVSDVSSVLSVEADGSSETAELPASELPVSVEGSEVSEAGAEAAAEEVVPPTEGICGSRIPSEVA